MSDLHFPVRRSRKRPRADSSRVPASSKNYSSALLLFFTAFVTTTPDGGAASAAEQYQYTAAPTEAPVSSNLGVVQTQDFCLRNYIKVEKLSILCDTPGAYYYGSNAYRNSRVCMSGDKAHLKIKFRIPSAMDYDAIYVKMELGIYNTFQEALVYGTTYDDYDDDSTQASLCQMNVWQLQPDTSYYDGMYGDPTECPFPGLYQLDAYYRVPAIADYNFKYTPDVRLQFLNHDGQRIGCVVTGPTAIHKAADIKARHGLVALTMAVGLILFLFATLLVMSHRRKKRIEAVREKRSGAAQQQRHPATGQYFRTLPNGQVVPATSAPPPPPQQQQQPSSRVGVPGPIPEDSEEDDDDDDDDDDDPLSISNPAYNETHIPTRPII